MLNTNHFMIPFRFPGLPEISAYFGTRMGGYSAAPYDSGNISLEVGDVAENVLSTRCSLQKHLGFTDWLELKQVHGPIMHFDPEMSSIEDAPTLEGDGLATCKPGVALAIKTADCQPVLLAHKDGGHIGALHVGWRGNVIGFIQSGIEEFCEHYGLKPQDVMAVRGPSLGPTASEFTNFSKEFGDAFEDYHDATNHTVDLWSLTRDQLLSAGLNPGNIFSVDLCTYGLPDHFFSYRKSNVTGRQVSLVWMWK